MNSNKIKVFVKDGLALFAVSMMFDGGDINYTLTSVAKNGDVQSVPGLFQASAGGGVESSGVVNVHIPRRGEDYGGPTLLSISILNPHSNGRKAKFFLEIRDTVGDSESQTVQLEIASGQPELVTCVFSRD